MQGDFQRLFFLGEKKKKRAPYVSENMTVYAFSLLYPFRVTAKILVWIEILPSVKLN